MDFGVEETSDVVELWLRRGGQGDAKEEEERRRGRREVSSTGSFEVSSPSPPGDLSWIPTRTMKVEHTVSELELSGIFLFPGRKRAKGGRKEVRSASRSFEAPSRRSLTDGAPRFAIFEREAMLIEREKRKRKGE